MTTTTPTAVSAPHAPAVRPHADELLPVALMFPGLGDQYIDMGLDLYRTQPEFRRQIDLCAELLKPELGLDIRDVIYPSRAAGEGAAPEPRPNGINLRKLLGRDAGAKSDEEARLNRTCFTQPALFVVEYALASLWKSWGLRPDAMIGYSLGEYVAACLSGVLSLEDSLTLVARRAALIDTLPPGAMLAVSLREEEVLPLLGAHLSLSAINGPELSVVAGPVEEVESLERRLAEKRIAVRRVKSSHAFHSQMMKPIADRVTELARGYTLKPPQIPYVSNATGDFITAAEATDPAYFATHLCRPVRFLEGVAALTRGTDRILLEAGPGQTLCSMVMQHPNRDPAKNRTAVASMRHSYDPQPDTAVLLKAVSRLWHRGALLDWDRFPNATLTDALGAHNEAHRSEASPALSATEEKLAEIWQKLLPIESVGRYDSFFNLGGNSLIATRLLLRISRAFNVKLSLRRLYEVPMLCSMAEAIDALKSGDDAAPMKSAPEPVTADASSPSNTTKPRMQLPNGLTITHQNEAETLHFYSDIFEHRSYVKHGMEIAPGACVFDVGANIGLFTLFAHTEAKDVRIFSFEPAPPMFEIVSRNVAEHGVNATLLNCGLSNKEAEAQFTFYPRSSGMSSFHADEAEEKHVLRSIMQNQRHLGMADVVDQVGDYAEELIDARFEAVPFTAKLRRLSDVIREHGVAKIDLMKVDVQKCELEVLEGIDEEDWSKIRQIVLEAHDVGNRVAAIRALLERHGFSCIVEQDEMYKGTNIHNIYAARNGR
ncbi:FkbM family methyltransferase [Sorangium sp. So ce1151]|uniref:FkbM family methyltransferase n=1 Tax=Sorangium sp. So ce1151 TaxID=3133332 RepID=UPI003F61DA33